MQAIFDDINDEFVEMSSELKLLKASFVVHKNLKEAGKLPHSMLWLQTAGFASAVEKIYTGCERVMERIARHIDKKPIDHAHACACRTFSQNEVGFSTCPEKRHLRRDIRSLEQIARLSAS